MAVVLSGDAEALDDYLFDTPVYTDKEYPVLSLPRLTFPVILEENLIPADRLRRAYLRFLSS